MFGWLRFRHSLVAVNPLLATHPPHPPQHEKYPFWEPGWRIRNWKLIEGDLYRAVMVYEGMVDMR